MMKNISKFATKILCEQFIGFALTIRHFSAYKVVKLNIKHTYINIYIILLICGIFFFIDEILTEPISDELLYKFKLGPYPLGGEWYTEAIQSFKDVIVSQYHQYFFTNGRFWVHILVQTFDSLFYRWVFALFNTIVFVSVIVLLMNFTLRKTKAYYNPLMWIITVCVYFYVFPGHVGLFLSIPGAFNYLWPMLLILIYLIVWQRYTPRGVWGYVGITLMAFFTGWSQECFSLPMSAAVFFYVILNRKIIGKKEVCMAFSLFIGASMLTFAPGNFVRITTTGRTGISGYIVSVFNAIDLFCEMKLILIFIIALIIAKIKGIRIREYIRGNELEAMCWLFSVLLGFVANTLPQSFTGIEFFSLILTYRLLCYSKITFSNNFCRSIAALLCIVFSCHQVIIAKYRYDMMTLHRSLLDAYIKSEDGLVIEPEVKLPRLVRPYVPDWTRSKVSWWRDYTITASYGSEDKPFRMLEPNEYAMVKSPYTEREVNGERVPGNLHCLQTKSGYWSTLTAKDTSANIQIILHPQTFADNPDFRMRLRYITGKRDYTDTIVKRVSEYELFQSDSLILIRIYNPINRRVKEINHREN